MPRDPVDKEAPVQVRVRAQVERDLRDAKHLYDLSIGLEAHMNARLKIKALESELASLED